ncbi:MAG: response regulator transcription factor [Coriobacteriia bacterium]|nr:response regulator transcription factor [Coriobacteriia bacterium]
MDSKITVAIVDDHPTFRYGLTMLLESSNNIRVIWEAENALQALTLLQDAQRTPMVMLLDVKMPGPDGVSMVKRLLQTSPGLIIIMLTASEEPSCLLQAISNGATGYLLKSESSSQIIDSIQRACQGQHIVNQKQIDLLLDNLSKLTNEAELSKIGLTKREIELVSYLANGLSNQEIAEKMFISVSSTKRMIDKIITTLGVSNRTQAVAELIKHGLI